VNGYNKQPRWVLFSISLVQISSSSSQCHRSRFKSPPVSHRGNIFVKKLQSAEKMMRSKKMLVEEQCGDKLVSRSWSTYTFHVGVLSNYMALFHRVMPHEHCYRIIVSNASGLAVIHNVLSPEKSSLPNMYFKNPMVERGVGNSGIPTRQRYRAC
jgi:hypothetical protein